MPSHQQCCAAQHVLKHGGTMLCSNASPPIGLSPHPKRLVRKVAMKSVLSAGRGLSFGLDNGLATGLAFSGRVSAGVEAGVSGSWLILTCRLQARLGRGSRLTGRNGVHLTESARACIPLKDIYALP